MEWIATAILAVAGVVALSGIVHDSPPGSGRHGSIDLSPTAWTRQSLRLRIVGALFLTAAIVGAIANLS